MLVSEDRQKVKAAGTCISAIATQEYHLGMWPDLIQTLCSGADSSEVQFKYAALQTLGFVCEDLDPTEFTQNDVNSILFSLLSNINPSNDHFTEISLRALLRATPITPFYFQEENQRSFIMTNLLNALKCEDEDILCLLAEILDSLAKLNYDFIGAYITQIDSLAHLCLDQNHHRAAKLAIGVWSTIADEEYRREQNKIPHQSIVKRCIENALTTVMRGLQYAENVDEWINSVDFDDTQCTVHAAWTLENIAKVAGNEIINPIFQYIQTNIQSDHWFNRFTSMIVFSAILDGPNPQKLADAISPMYDYLLNMLLTEPTLGVKFATSYSLFKMSEFVPQVIFDS